MDIVCSPLSNVQFNLPFVPQFIPTSVIYVYIALQSVNYALNVRNLVTTHMPIYRYIHVVNEYMRYSLAIGNYWL